MKNILTLLLTLFSTLAIAQDVNTFVPKNAYIYVPILRAEQLRIWPTHPKPEMLAGLGEQESCISLTSDRCWSPTAELNTKREFGQGIGQTTKAFRPDGSLRFDSLTEMAARYKTELGGWNWANNATRPDLQLRAIVLLNQENYNKLYTIKAPVVRLQFADAAYNGGLGGVDNDRRACGLRANCNTQLWFDNVATSCTKSALAIYGTRSACIINREHVVNVINVRSKKYCKFFQ